MDRKRIADYYAKRTVADPERYGVQTYGEAFAHMVRLLS